MFSFLFHLLYQKKKLVPKFCFLKFSSIKNHLKSCIFFWCMMTTMEQQSYGVYQFPGPKNNWEAKYFLNFLVLRNVFPKGYFLSISLLKNL